MQDLVIVVGREWQAATAKPFVAHEEVAQNVVGVRKCFHSDALPDSSRIHL